MKRQATDWEKYLQNTYDDKGSKIYKDFLKSMIRKQPKKQAKDTSPKIIYRCQMNTWKQAQYHILRELKIKIDINMPLPE